MVRSLPRLGQRRQAEARGRLIQSMKSHLGSANFKHTVILNSTFTLEELIAMLIRMLKTAAETQFGPVGDRVVVGRPAHFSGTETDAEDAAAESVDFHTVGLRLREQGDQLVEKRDMLLR